MQREGRYDEAIDANKTYLKKDMIETCLQGQQLAEYTEALMQLMNTFQSKGEPEACISALQDVFDESPTFQDECLRDFYSVMGYALSRTEDMDKAEEITLKALTLPLHHATPERYFRDYAYATAVFYSNPSYSEEVINWCEEALQQAQLCNNTSGIQWVMTILGSLYKREGELDKALELFQQSKDEAQSRGDELGVLNSLNSLIDIFLYFDTPEYADMYATEAIDIHS